MQPGQYRTLHFEAPFGESTHPFAADDLAYEVINLERTAHGTLRSLRGPCPYERDQGEGYFSFGRIHGIFHAGLLGGEAPTLFVRAGTKIYRHVGANQTFEVLVQGLSDDTTVRQADCFTLVGDQVIWSNGVDRAQSITYDGVAVPLGFDRPPGAPFVEGPTQPPAGESGEDSDRTKNYPNSLGYSWPGGIGTLGDVRSPTEGSLLAGTWFYYEQDEDLRKNLSPVSPASNPLELFPQSVQELVGTTNIAGVQVDDLLRQSLVRFSGQSSPWAFKRHLYRTPDTRNVGTEPLYLATDQGTRPAPFPDQTPDAELNHTRPLLRPMAVPAFHLSFAWGNRLVILIRGEMWISMPGRYGTFLPEHRYAITDGGAEITAGIAHGSRIILWTRRSTIDATPALSQGDPVKLSSTIGCESHASVKALRDGRLVWLSLGGFYAMAPGAAPAYVSAPIHSRLQLEVNKGAFRQAVAVVDPLTGEYRCGVAQAGRRDNNWMYAYDIDGQWRRLEIGIEVEALCVTDDPRNYVLIGGRDTGAAFRAVFVMGHEYEQYDIPARTWTFWSKEITAAKGGETRGTSAKMHVNKIRFQLRETYAGNATVTTYRNGGKVPYSTHSLRLIGLDKESIPDGTGGIAREVFGAATLGTVAAREPRLFWREVPVQLKDVYSFSFKVTADHPIEIELQSVEISASVNTTKGENQARLASATGIDTL